MTNKINAIIDSTLLQVLAESDSDVEAGPLHEPIVRLVLARLRARRLYVRKEQVRERLQIVLGGEP